MPMPLRAERFSTPADKAACRGAIRQGSLSFHLASRLLPVAVREPAYAVYAFCRMADDRIDRDGGGEQALGEIAELLDRIYAGRPGRSVIARTFADVVAEHAIPRAVPDALVEGLAWDAAGRRYETPDDLLAYAVRVAGTVGIMMTLVMGRRDPAVLARGCDLGVAMQLTNICRDVGEDARAGRLYLPLEMLRGKGVDPDAFLARPSYEPGVEAVVADLLGRAEALYDRALPGIAGLPSGCRLGINAARLLYREIGRTVAGGLDPVAARAVVPGRRKLGLLLATVGALAVRSEGLHAPCLPQARLIAESVDAAPAPSRASLPGWWNVQARTARLLDLLATPGYGRADLGGP